MVEFDKKEIFEWCDIQATKVGCNFRKKSKFWLKNHCWEIGIFESIKAFYIYDSERFSKRSINVSNSFKKGTSFSFKYSFVSSKCTVPNFNIYRCVTLLWRNLSRNLIYVLNTKDCIMSVLCLHLFFLMFQKGSIFLIETHILLCLNEIWLT